ncbi:MAG: ATP-binding cassette domain-containing protein [Acidobacteria bacterium]|nr:ATP-binding cassette domain-containing protein [Acidobacteriota bacterium]
MRAESSLNVSDASFAYVEPVVRQVALNVSPGSCVGLLGANGAGKTTLLKLLAGLLSPDSGTVRYGDQNVADLAAGDRARLIGYLPQRIPRATGFAVHEIVLMGLYSLLPARHWEGRSEWLAVARALRRIDSLHLLRRSFAELSGGEQRRVLLARALVGDPSLLLLDEPLAALDPGFVLDFTATLGELRDQGVSLVISSHRLSFVRALADSVVVLRRGEFIAQGDPGQILDDELLNAAYGTERFGAAAPTRESAR